MNLEPQESMIQDLPPKPEPPLIGKAILLQEEICIVFHDRQYNQELNDTSFHDKVARMISSMNSDLSMPDENRDNILAQRTKNLLRNSAVKSQIATYLALQYQLERLSSIVSMIGSVDKKLSDAETINDMSPNQLMFMQRSLHKQFNDILMFVESQKLEGLETLLTSIVPSGNREISSATTGMMGISPNSRDRVQFLLSKMISKLKVKNEKQANTDQIDVEGVVDGSITTNE